MGNHISLLSASSGRVATAPVIFARASLFWLTLAVSGVRRSEVHTPSSHLVGRALSWPLLAREAVLRLPPAVGLDNVAVALSNVRRVKAGAERSPSRPRRPPGSLASAAIVPMSAPVSDRPAARSPNPSVLRATNVRR